MEREWIHISVAQRSQIDFSNWIAILPLGAHEQHGPHLPFETDALIAAGVCERLVQRLPHAFPVTVLPVEAVGYSPEHLDYAGSKSLAYDEAIERWIAIGKDLYEAGISKLMLLNAHGGNSPLLTIVATELRVRYSMFVVATSWTRMGTPQDLIAPDEKAFGIHGGDIETSVMMALHPELVKRAKFQNFANFQQEMVAHNTYLRAYGKHAFGWKMQDLNMAGVVGDMTKASAEKGEQLLDFSVAGLHQLLDEMARFDMNHLALADALNMTGTKSDAR